MHQQIEWVGLDNRTSVETNRGGMLHNATNLNLSSSRSFPSFQAFPESKSMTTAMKRLGLMNHKHSILTTPHDSISTLILPLPPCPKTHSRSPFCSPHSSQSLAHPQTPLTITYITQPPATHNLHTQSPTTSTRQTCPQTTLHSPHAAAEDPKAVAAVEDVSQTAATPQQRKQSLSV